MVQIHVPEPIVYEEPVYSENTLKYIYKDGEAGGQCVTFIQRYYDSFYTDPSFRGTAINIAPNSMVPEVNGAVILADSELGHVAIILDIVDDELVLLESNYSGDEIIGYGRRISIDDYKILGYYIFHE